MKRNWRHNAVGLEDEKQREAQISRYDNDESRTHGRAYKQQFALLPTVDHVGDGIGPADFKICSWRTNDSKSDLSLDEFLHLCKAVLEYHRISVST
jgi:hypothetical protein